MEYYNQALTLSREIRDRSKEALALKSVGLVYFQMKQLEKAIEFTRLAIKIYDETHSYEGDSARKQLEHLSNVQSRKSPRFIVIPIGLIVTLIVAIFLNLMRGNDSGNSTGISEAATLSAQTATGSIAGMVVDKNRVPLVNVQQGDVGIVALFCPTNDLDVECLHENDMDLDISVLLSSICDANDISESCLLHWGRSAAKITAGGSYILRDIPPGEYDLEVIIISSGIVLTVHVINVEPVQAGETTLYDFVTK